ncbi:CRISPR-associated endonuclease/helicase Cas3 [Streptomyces sp. V3I8]|uniref:CRISPR-associated helicase Cas3' n=1 Tax=Streptomyces sp. V3I8 TaxID=3042279 RepID=UPI00278858FD|nr:CRISPR-associated helicase Cas3' [Streptomyces sp. V3I8]MDQ1034860.1 CRISPR-associated endonuclease/helicase Cas3 [Streptomyces sp. V3I8]
MVDVRELSERYEPLVVRALETLWGKSRERAGGTTNLLLAHLVDTAAVAELLWDGFLARSTRSVLDEVAGGPGRGRRLFAWLCGVHDCGKASPAHQRLWPEGAEAVRRSGLTWVEAAAVAGAKQQKRWRHDWAGGLMTRELLAGAGWDTKQLDWVWPLVAGHHGAFPSIRDVQEPRHAKGQLRGRGTWRQVQQAVLDVFTQEVGFGDLREVEPGAVPSRALQLQLSGLVVMADWIASDERFFVGVDDLRLVSLDASRERAASAWQALGLQGGWGALTVPGPEAFRDRFGYAPRPSQAMVVEMVRRMGGPGIVVVEAPMGEGKTEAAQAAAEVLAARFGADGVFVGMPTQATSDPMFTRTRQWLEAIEGRLASRVVLLHGKRAFNREWKALLEDAGAYADEAFCGVDEFGLEDDPYGVELEVRDVPERQAPAEWFLGSKRGLLAPFVVGTVDQLLYAATRTRHVMLRMAGLAGKVVILDEVHACDVYMSQFLQEALRWLGQAGVPVIILSATLAPAQRQALVEAYLAGAASREELRVEVPLPSGYPSVTTAWLPASGEPQIHVDATDSWREDLGVQVRVVPEAVPGARCSRQERERLQGEADARVRDLLASELADGGTALVIRNSVARAQSLYKELRGRFGKDEVRLLHARFTVARRADLTQESLRLLGPRTPRPRGGRLILVATQLAEQSFDVDADLLVTDLAPVDLLLQRVGRLHRHEETWRPDRLRVPQVFLTGFEPREGREPAFAFASEMIYGRHLLLRTAAVLPGAGEAWLVPRDVPGLVARVYGADASLLPEMWREAGEEACREQESRDRMRAENARQFLLTAPGEYEKRTLAGLHYGGSTTGSDEGSLQAAVRDGDESVEVVLVVREEGDAVFRTLAGRALSVNGEVAPDVLEEVLGSAVRLPSKLTQVASQLRPLPGWHGHPWLRHSRALVLDGSCSIRLGDLTVSYDDEFGLREQ